MLLYLDTSAFVPLIVEEPSSARCRQLWQEADIRCSSLLVHVEAAAALGQANRIGRLTAHQLGTGLQATDTLLSAMVLISVTPETTTTAAALAVEQGLRGYDAVHAATALSVASADTAAVSGDRTLLAAWSRLGLTTIATS
ncbi:type II toxin-antitoxin system VapC family toxin [Georgenia sp. TF02-10]|uniref:type II toxin-antitoxin system VapC family toxin n=1 Tax=Georgenia sp. TF02-10 TaxID=2917725 RepID=UPI001FA6FB75|nr:type II toxin-antitoxin system VapC family toxin [Georgenia sp. TF02-10]UNX53209.1 type II toxin-antitoxin system VapC family toxin [Georgenia sp. TF02-10]